MIRKLTAPAAAFLAAATMTFFLFSAVAGLADADRALLLTAKHSATLIAGNTAPLAR